MQEFVKGLALYVAYFAEIAAAMVIVVGTIQAVFVYVKKGFIERNIGFKALGESRIKLGVSLSLGLGFLVGADVVKTAVAPTWRDIGHIAAIVAIRIVLNEFLMRDLKQIQTEDLC